MRPQERIRTVARALGAVLPHSVEVLSGEAGWNAWSRRGLRQLGEVALDELVVTGMTLAAPPPSVSAEVAGYPGVAEALTAAGLRGAYVEPEPLRVRSIRRRLAGRFAFEELTYTHDPRLPECLTGGGPATAVCNLVRHPGGPRPWLVWVHGAGQGGLSDFAVARIGRIHRTLGYNIAMPIQPGHGPRRDWWPAYPDTDPVVNVAGMMRTVSEVRAVIRWLQPQASTVALAGLSLGSGVAALVAGFEEVDGVALYTPILGLNAMIANHLHRWGGAADDVGAVLGSPEVAALTSVIDPLAMEPTAPPQRRLIVGAWHDQMAMRTPASAMHDRWGGEIYWHQGGHVGHLFSGKVQRVTERFLRAVAGADPDSKEEF
ncbi:alpha/beta hydrolase [[Mycobacterium] wendilense]|uniref:Alpha/beta hydrolase n=1 Tax=[Mycobacterium] wendilense TaxID=3064284 RepID=A0ABN9P103_9MYCO|nr:alpha/beta hydrolase [Mycolicibacterium sp. MU0050]CAJ1579604.1 alpha/beta hydrolase [Mycolicibacterium sp. MU0050]